MNIHSFKSSSATKGLILLCNMLALSVYGSSIALANEAVLHGEPKVWHTLSLDIAGPLSNESQQSTFTDYRLTAVFSHADESFVIPGYFAADGAAELTHAKQGKLWRAKFVPNLPGEWTYTAVLEQGENIALKPNHEKGIVVGSGKGKFSVAAADIDSSQQDFRYHGRIQYVDSHIAEFAGSRLPFIKGGAGSPENMLAYSGFDGTYDAGQFPEFPALGENQLHEYAPHLTDWQEGDPLWRSESGLSSKGIVGMINYLSDQGVNSFYFMPLTYHGDGWDVWPWVEPEKFYNFDVSKLAQWQQLFTHMQRKGIHLHVLLTETENENLFELREGGEFANARKLYYREMIARFAHHLAITWNLGEENGWDDEKGKITGKGNSDAQRRSFIQVIAELDTYDNAIKSHEILDVDIFTGLYDEPLFSGPSLQRHSDYNQIVSQFVMDSYTRGKPWLVSMDEPLGWEFGLRPDGPDNNHEHARKAVLWGSLMGGATGVEWYFGWQNNAPTSDLSNENMRVRHSMWEQTQIAQQFFTHRIPANTLIPNNALIRNHETYEHAYAMETNELALGVRQAIFYTSVAANKPREALVVQVGEWQKKPHTGNYMLTWFDPLTGEEIPTSNPVVVNKKGIINLGLPPSKPTQDWLAILSSKT